MDALLHCEHAVVVDGEGRDRVAADVVVEVADGTIVDVTTGRSCGDCPRRAVHLSGVTMPGLVNAHSHAFHRLLRGRVQHRGPGPSADANPGTNDFWGWREHMYALAGVLDEQLLAATATAVFGEMALAGITTVGEFHYLHHRPDGTPHEDANLLGHTLARAADRAGIRMTLLDACYLVGGVGATTDEPGLGLVQRRFSDGSARAWRDRTADLVDTATVRHGAAIHSVRAVPPDAMAVVAATARERGWVLHAHVAEQRREVDDTRDLHGHTPVGLLAEAGALGEHFTAVHGVWLDDHDRALLGDSGAIVCACPTTEADLADGIVSARALVDADVRVALGSDQHVAVDLLAEARALEHHQRLATHRRGLHDPVELLGMATRGGAASLGWPEGGRLAVGAAADLCVVGTDAPRLAGTPDDDLAAAVVFAATAADVTDTMVAGRWVVRDGHHAALDVPGTLADAMQEATTRLADLPGATP